MSTSVLYSIISKKFVVSNGLMISNSLPQEETIISLMCGLSIIIENPKENSVAILLPLKLSLGHHYNTAYW